MKRIILPLILLIFLIASFWFLYTYDPYSDFDKMFVDFVTRSDRPVVTTEELLTFSSYQNDFSFRLFGQIAKEEENAFISPYSIHSALMLAFLGADENTKKEMQEVLVLLEVDEGDVKKKALALKRHMEDVSDTTEVSIANALFLRDDISFHEKYKEEGQKYFEAEITDLPFTGNRINEWVREKTNRKIEEVINPGPIDRNVIAYLINAIYFKGMWEIEFEEERTALRPFYGAEEAEVEMMSSEEEYYHHIDDEFQAVTVEYENGDYLFHAIMPAENSSLSRLYRNLDAEKLKEIKEEMKKGEIILRIPKFTMEKGLQLKEVLKALGMVEAFERDNADFSKMVDLEGLSLNVFISEVFHSSFIEVDEKGTEAAAVTTVEVGITSLPMVKTIEFNRPFFFIIEESQTGTILFMGQFVNPS